VSVPGRAVVGVGEHLPLTGRLLAIDLGEVRIGLALSDPGQVVASPAETLHVPRDADEPTLAALVDAAARHDAVGVVVGYPRRLDGREGSAAARARLLADALCERTGLPGVLVDERFTTTEAERVMLAQDASRDERRRSIDRVAASVLLQTVLAAQRARREAARIVAGDTGTAPDPANAGTTADAGTPPEEDVEWR
jgi:putative Holliday junction resolvase